jgi:(1->4)-alpha-D-glucan 1-alpha-D-glucosylmutase
MQALDDLLRRTAEYIAERRRFPEATYRLQFHAGFTFRDAQRLTPYLYDLGISHAYASPYLRARPGSTHGYDIVDHNGLNPEIGSQEDYNAWVESLRGHGMGHILDMVPNHMGVASNDNAWWNDVLENGPASRYAGYFDIAWRANLRPELQDKVLLPVLGEPYGDVLEKGELRLAFESGAFAIQYYDRHFPAEPRAYGMVLEQRLEELTQVLGAESPALAEYQSVLTAIHHLPGPSETDPARLAVRQREKEVIKRRLAALAGENQSVREFIEGNVTLFNGAPGQPRSFDLLDSLLERQCYRLAYWRVAPDEINYRRFFDINDLAAVSMERDEVFEASHRLVLELAAEGKLNGLRIDHPDGLYDPARYFRELQVHYQLACARKIFGSEAAGEGEPWSEIEGPLQDRLAAGFGRGPGAERWPLYVVAEKILGIDEPLPEDWAIHGTSGYDFLNQVNGLFIDRANAEAFTRLYANGIQDDTRYPELVYRKKLLILNVSLASELHMLAYELDRLAQKSRRSRDFTFNMLRLALREVIACFPVYRSYVADDGARGTDRRYIEVAVQRATARNPLLSRRLFRLIRDMLLLQYPESFTEEDRAEQRRFTRKFQQVTAPVIAKGVEDTVFYVYNRLLSLNEVGGEPARFGITPEALHEYHINRQVKWPYALSPLSTHDTKRSEDVRARLNVLSEIPDEWRSAVARWSGFNALYRQPVEDLVAPDANEEYLLYQTLVGAWPLEACTSQEYAGFVERIQSYLEKALHEAKVHTSWINPNENYDAAVREFVTRVLDPANQAFLDDFRAFQRRISEYGLYNSLAQTLLKITCPGVPDTYQGTELWDFSLVDPDNRRPVDYERCRTMLRELQASTKGSGPEWVDVARRLLSSKEDGRIKLYVTWRALHCRRHNPGLFTRGQYVPLAGAGDKAEHLFAFARQADNSLAVVAIPRLLVRLAAGSPIPRLDSDVWGRTSLQLSGIDRGLRWQNVFTGQILMPTEWRGALSLAAADLFRHFPVALLLASRRD